MRKQIMCSSVLTTLVLLCSLSCSVFAAPPAMAVKPAASGKVSPQSLQNVDFPVIQSFNVQPKTVQGDPLNFSWNITPGPGGSPVTQVRITLNNATILYKTGQPQSQNYTVPFSGYGNLTFLLTATNSAGKTATKSKTVQIFQLGQVMAGLKVANLEATPQVFQPGQQIDFRLMLQNNSQVPLSGLNIFVMQGARVVANLTNQIIPYGTTRQFMLRDSGYLANNTGYMVDVEYKGMHVNRGFKIKPVTSYTIDPF